MVKKRVGLMVKSDAETCAKAEAFESWLKSKGHSVVMKKSVPPVLSAAPCQGECAPADLYCVFVLGGDGTFLSAVRWVGDQGIPILGIKFGEVGFLAEAMEENLLSVAETILNDGFTTRPRMRLWVTVIRDGREIAKETVLNDVVITKGVLARLALIKTYINDSYLTAYRADGLIVSTPTGSTAYSLAAGGPILHPSVPGIIISPICPFTLTNRPLIVPDSVSIKMLLDEKSSDLQLTCDGQVGLEIDARDTIIVRKSAHPVNMITLPDQDYFDLLRTKLKWSGSRV